MGCGASIAENCTYFESAGTEVGQCSLEVCPCSTGISQMRLDFTNFVVTGPSISTVTVGQSTAGVLNGKGIGYSFQTNCLTDTFSVRSSSGGGRYSPPTICGTNTNEHMYADMSDDDCNSLDFALGHTGVGATIPTRSFSIKVTQIACDSNLRAPQGCTQWYYGATTNTVRTFNYADKKGLHLANQNQNICIRQERGNCKICWSAQEATDFDVSGKFDTMKALVGTSKQLAGNSCCSYKTDGMGTKGYDCLLIPGALKTDLTPIGVAANAFGATMFCGQSKGLGTVKSGTASKTICSKTEPFRIQFVSDGIESLNEGKADAVPESSGFQLAYIMSAVC